MIKFISVLLYQNKIVLTLDTPSLLSKVLEPEQLEHDVCDVSVVPGADVRSLRRLQWPVRRGPQGSGDAHLTAAQGAPQGYIHCKSWVGSPLVKYITESSVASVLNVFISNSLLK